MLVKHLNTPKGKRKRLTLRLPIKTWKATAEAARGAGLCVNDLIEAILRSWNGRIPPVNK